MKKIFSFILSGVLLTTFNSCKKDPIGCASSDKSSALVDETITFTSCSENALRITWDFGDNKTEEGNSVTHFYSKTGTYLVKMTAYSKKDKEWDRTAMIVTITDPPVAPAPLKRFLTKIVLKAVPDKKPNGDEWDGLYAFGTSTGTSTSDPSVLLKLETGGWSLTSSIIKDVSSGALPATWDFSPDNILLINEKWTIEVWDGQNGNALYDSVPELMNGWTSINLSTATATNGVISLSYGAAPDAYSLDIYFEER